MKKLISILLITIMTLSLTSCNFSLKGKKEEKPKTETSENIDGTKEETQSYSSLEDFMNKHPEELKRINEEAAELGVKTKIEGNTILYDFSLDEYGLSESQASDKNTIKLLEESMETQKPVFISLAKTMETSTKVSEVSVILRYSFKDKTILEKTYTTEEESE